MYKVKLSPEEALETIKLRMKYDSSKTLNENIGVIKEQTEDEKIANEIWSGAYNGGMGTSEKKIVSGLKKIQNANQFASVDALLKKLSGLDITQTINDEFGDDDASSVTSIANHLSKIGLKVNSGVTSKIVGMAATPQNNFSGTFSISKTTTPKPETTPAPAPEETKKDTENTKTVKDTATASSVTTPSGLTDVKGFQDWLDKNKPGWAAGYKDGIVNKGRGYGTFGPRTKKAWETYKDEFLKTPTTPSVTPSKSEEEEAEAVYGDNPNDIIATN